MSRCKDCTKSAALAAYYANPGPWKKRSREWQQTHPEAHQDSNRRWATKNRGHIAEYNRLRRSRPDIREREAVRVRAYHEHHSRSLTDAYLRRQLADTSLGIKPADVPQGLVELKRAQLLIRRKIDTDYRPTSRDRVCQHCGKAYTKKKGRKPSEGNTYCSQQCAFADVKSWHSKAGEFKPASRC